VESLTARNLAIGNNENSLHKLAGLRKVKIHKLKYSFVAKKHSPRTSASPVFTGLCSSSVSTQEQGCVRA
jgi:hypothetical protein